MTPWLTALVVVLALAGCAAQSGGRGDPSPSPRPSAATEGGQPSPSDGAGGGAGGSDEISGTLGADSIEGGCAYIQDGRTRYEVIYPDGWEIRAAPLELRNPEGEVVATGGETITVRGSEAGDMASICMIGPIFDADEVVSIEE